ADVADPAGVRMSVAICLRKAQTAIVWDAAASRWDLDLRAAPRRQSHPGRRRITGSIRRRQPERLKRAYSGPNVQRVSNKTLAAVASSSRTFSIAIAA